MTSTIKVNKIEKESGSTLTLGGPSTAVTLACGATQSGFGRTGTVDWCTTAKTGPLTVESGKGYFINTTSGGITVTLPASPNAGDIVSVSDYAQTASCNAITVGRNGSKIDGLCNDLLLETDGIATTLVYVDGTKGWKPVNSNEVQNVLKYVAATGGTVTTSGNFKIHTFTSSSTFTVSCAGSAAGSNTVDYLVVAGGGGGGNGLGGGGGAGGYRESSGTASGCYSVSPLGSGVAALPVSVQGYPVTVGGGGGAAAAGNVSTFSSISSAGGGLGGQKKSGSPVDAGAGGSGGGQRSAFPCSANSQTPVGGAGNTPPVSPPQGNTGGRGFDGSCFSSNQGGGGGATAVGFNAQGPTGTPKAGGGNGGTGATSSINGTPTGRAGGGGGSSDNNPQGAGADGGGTAAHPVGGAGTANTGGGGGGGQVNPCGAGGAGGSGIVIIRYKFQ
jgi:hypothetical protein